MDKKEIGKEKARNEKEREHLVTLARVKKRVSAMQPNVGNPAERIRKEMVAPSA